jgi:hypothetical protein
VAWPQPTDYNEAVQTPRLCFKDPELQAGEVVVDALDMPLPYSGNFADVYQIRGPNGQAWAVKCFTREVSSLQSRYQAISHHLKQGSPPFMVQFRYLTEGIRVGGKWYPVLKMDWVQGFTLNEFARLHAHKPHVMYRLAQMWVKLSLQLRRANMAHADLQHGNVLLVPGERASQLSMRLIDYDGMCVPALANAPSGEVGHPNYQHPQRLAEGVYNAEVDRFPHLVIYTALRCLTVGGRELWEKHDNGENLLFREQDFKQSAESQLLLDLWQLPDPDIRRLLGHLLMGSQAPLEQVALLDETVGSEGRPSGLTDGQERHLLDLLPPGAARMKILPATVSKFSLEQLIATMDDEPLNGSIKSSARTAEARAERAANGVATRVGAVETAAEPASSPDPRSVAATPKRQHMRLPDPALFFPALCRPCKSCGNPKHILESICPHCSKADWRGVALAIGTAVAFLVLAFIGLPFHEPGILGVVGGIAGFGALVAVPLATGLLVNALRGKESRHADAVAGVRWPAGQERCLRCGGSNTILGFCCRLCGRLSWVRLSAVGAFAITVAALVAVAQPDPEAPVWWVALSSGVRWLGRPASAAAALIVFFGILEVWQLQPRLPKEGRLKFRVAQGAMAVAIAVPLICGALLVFSLYTH